MKVKELMQTKVFTVSQDDPIDRIFFLIHYERIRHLPVLHRRKIVGIVSDRDLYKALGPRTGSRSVAQGTEGTRLYVIPKRVRHIMRRGVITISPEARVGEAAGLMASRKIGALPVVRGGKLVGIVTSTDLLKTLANLATKLDKLVSTT